MNIRSFLYFFNSSVIIASGICILFTTSCKQTFPYVLKVPGGGSLLVYDNGECYRPPEVAKNEKIEIGTKISTYIKADISIDEKVGKLRSIGNEKLELFETMRFYLCMYLLSGIVNRQEAYAIEKLWINGPSKPEVADEKSRINQQAKEVIEAILETCNEAKCMNDPTENMNLSRFQYETLLANLKNLPVFFLTGSAKIRDTYKDTLRDLAGRVGIKYSVLIVGRASKIGDKYSNSVLARKRAENVRDFFLSVGGSKARLVYVVNFGETIDQMKPDSPLARQRRQTEQFLNQSAWIFAYGE